MPFEFDWSILVTYWPLLWAGATRTLRLVALITVVGFSLGILVGSVRALVGGFVSTLGGAFVEVFRNIPPIVMLFFLYFGVGLELWTAAIAGLGFYASAEISETVRSGISSIPRTQMEAAESTGLTRWEVIRKIIVPQAVLIVLPVFGTHLISILKGSAIAMTIGLQELTFQTREISNRTFRGFEVATVVTLVYLLMSLLILSGVHVFERISKVQRRLG